MYPSAHKKYHGLINHGATCYLNSVLQVLFMTPDFREALKRATNDDPEFIDRHLKDLFDDLLRCTPYTYKILQILHIDRVYEQRDAAEYLEKILRLTSPDAAKIFHGELTNITTCSKCETHTNRDGLFWYLPLPLMDSCSGDYRVVDGLEEFFKASYLHGDNQMYCEQCDIKVNAERKNVVKHHPDVLILLLKRFDFSYRYMSYVKINCAVDVPYSLQVPENQTYELYAVVDHFGDLRSGHYTATIKDQDENTWYNFDDTSVTQLVYPPFMDNEKFVKSASAFLLFYRKKDTASQGSMVPTNEGSPTSTCANYNESHDAENVRRKQELVEGEVSDETAAAGLDISSACTYEISVSNERRMSSDLSFQAHHPEVKTVQVQPELPDVSPEGHVREQESNEGKIIRDDQTEQRNLLPNEVQEPNNPEPVELKGMKPDVYHDFTSVSDLPAVGAVCYNQEDISNPTSRASGEETDEKEKTEKREQPLNKHGGQDYDTECSNVGQSIEESCSNPTGGDDNGLKSADADKEGDEGRIKTDIKCGAEGRIDSDQVRSPKKLLKIYDLCWFGCESDHRKRSTTEDVQKHEHGNQEREAKGRVDIGGEDQDGGQSKSGRSNSFTHEMQSTEGVAHNKNQENEENTDTSHASDSEIRETLIWSPGTGDHENTKSEIPELKARGELQGVIDDHQSPDQPGDECITAEQSGGKRSKTTEDSKPAEETSHASAERHDRNAEDVSKDLDINKAKAGLSTAVSSMKLSESSSEVAGIKYTLRKRGLKKSNCRGYLGRTSLAAYRERKRQNWRKCLGLSKGRRTRIRTQRRTRRK